MRKPSINKLQGLTTVMLSSLLILQLSCAKDEEAYKRYQFPKDLIPDIHCLIDGKGLFFASSTEHPLQYEEAFNHYKNPFNDSFLTELTGRWTQKEPSGSIEVTITGKELFSSFPDISELKQSFYEGPYRLSDSSARNSTFRIRYSDSNGMVWHSHSLSFLDNRAELTSLKTDYIGSFGLLSVNARFTCYLMNARGNLLRLECQKLNMVVNIRE